MQLLEEAVAKPTDAVWKQHGDFDEACLDADKAEKSSKAELDALLKHSDTVKDLNTLAKEVAREHITLGAAMFDFGQQQDFKDANQVIGGADQGGIGLPDRDYYLL